MGASRRLMTRLRRCRRGSAGGRAVNGHPRPTVVTVCYGCVTGPRRLRELGRQAPVTTGASTRRNGHPDGRAPARLALDAELAAVGHYQVLDDREPEPGAAELARARLVDAIEPLGDPRQIDRRNADARVDHVDRDLAV